MTSRVWESLAALMVAAISLVVALALIRVFEAARYDYEVVINIVGLAFLTFMLAVPGALAIVAALIITIAQRKFVPWVRAAMVGAAIAAIFATCLAFAAGCVPQCNGSRGSLVAGLLVAIPAGFGVGGLAFAVWRWLTNRLIAALVIKRIS